MILRQFVLTGYWNILLEEHNKFLCSVQEEVRISVNDGKQGTVCFVCKVTDVLKKGN